MTIYKTYSVLLLALIYSLPFQSYAQGTLVERPAGTTPAPWGFVEYLPTDYNDDPNKLFPVIIHLSGHGERGNGTSDLNKVTRNGPLNLIKNGNWPVLNKNGDPPAENFIIIGPQSSGGFYNATRQSQLIEYVLDRYRADPNRIYALGLSAGGYGVWGVVGNYPDVIAAGIAICGSGRAVERFACDWKDVPVWAFHGDNDNQVGISGSTRPVNAVNSCNPPPDPRAKLTVYPGAGHNVWTRTYNLNGMGTERNDYDLFDISIYDWLLQYSKDTSSPTADAGPDKEITLPTNSLTLNGSGNDPDGTIDSYSWTKVSGPTVSLSNANNPTATASNLVVGIYKFKLEVTDNDGFRASDQMQVVVNPAEVNQPPTVNAGSNITITLPTNSTNINGSASDIDGSIVSYTWTQRSGPSTASLSGVNGNTLTCNTLIEGTYTFRLTVSDDDGASAFDEVDVIVNPEIANSTPTSNAGNDQSINLPTNSTTLSGSGSDTDGSIVSYSWQKISGPNATLTNVNSPTLTLSDLVEGVYLFQLSVTDDDGATGTDQVSITVLAINQNPNSNAGDDITITLPTNSTTLNGSGSDPNGNIQSYAWIQLSGPSSSTIGSPANAMTNVSGLIEGSYQFQLIVTDNDDAEDSDIVNVNVEPASTNIAPTANAGEDIFITLPNNSVTINGIASDIDGSITDYEWSVLSGPSTFLLTNENTASVSIENMVAGIYTLNFTVTDDNGATDIDGVKINVAEENVNIVPVANAGPDKSITLPLNSVVFNGAATDNDGSVETINWTQQSGPSNATLSGQNTLELTVTDLIEGSYNFELEVTDNEGATDTDNAIVTVSAVNQAPDVSAGPNQTVTLPDNTLSITGSATDIDGTISSTNWVKVSGPSVNINVIDNVLELSSLIEGVYTFMFSATDNDGAVSNDNVKVFVISSNQTPSVDAGENINLTLPVNNVNITAVANDPDGNIVSFNWSKVSGPVVTVNNTTTQTISISNLTEGVYEFTVSVTDNDGGSNSDNVIIEVFPASTNIAPIANAGEDKNLTLPTNSINLVGSGSDPDGVVAQYQWTKRSGPAVTISNASSSTLTLNNLVEGVYKFRLTVLDDDDATDFDEVNVFVASENVNQNPVADAKNDIQLTLPTNSTNIFGSGSDLDGFISSYEWTQISGPSIATISGSNQATLTITNLIEGAYIFNLLVTDDDGAVNNDEVTVIVLSETANTPPIADAGSNKTIILPDNTLTLNGSGSDSDGSIQSYSWVKFSGPQATLQNESSASLIISDLIQGVYRLRLTVTDNEGDIGSDEVIVQVIPENINQSPMVNAGGDINLILPENSIEVNGSATDSDGTVVSYSWSKKSGGQVDLANTDTPKLLASNMLEGIYEFTLSALDNEGALGSDAAKVNVLPEGSNIAPLANAGSDQEIILPDNTLNLDGSGSSDQNGSIISYEWDKVSGPNVTITNANQVNAILTDLNEGVYVFRLTVVDNDGASDFDDVKILVLPTGTNQNPVANAGQDIAIIAPDASVTITGFGSDSDGTIDNYTWSFINGPSAPIITGENTRNLMVSELIIGVYVFELTVTDDGGAEDSDEMQVFVNPKDDELITDPPIADAGEDVTTTLPSTITLTGTAQSENIIEKISWRQMAGPTLTNLPADTSQVVLDGLQVGSYVLEFYVEDINGLSDTDEVAVKVRDDLAANDFPKVFTPNGDGINDFWVVEDLEKIEDCSLTIYDKYGKAVFEANPYDNTWSGSSTSGRTQVSEAYFYVFKCPGAENFSGGVRIMR